VRSAVILATAGVVMVVAVLIGGAVYVPLADQVSSYDSVDSKYTGAIDDMERVIMIWMPVILLGGSVLTAGLLALRRSGRQSTRRGLR